MLELQFDAGPNADEAGSVRESFLRIGVPALQRAMDQVAPGDDVLRFEKVVIDLGKTSPNNVAAAFQESLERITSKRLRELAPARRCVSPETLPEQSSNPRDASETGVRATAIGRHERLAVAAHECDQELPRGVFRNRHEEVAEFAERFFEHGDALWWSNAQFPGDPESAANVGRILAEAYQRIPSLRQKLFAILMKNPGGIASRLAGESWLRPLVSHLRSTGRFFSAEASRRAAKTRQFLEELPVAKDRDVDIDVLLGLVFGAGRHLSPADETRQQKSGGVDRVEKFASREAAASETGHVAVLSTSDVEPDVKTVFVEDAGIVLLQPFVPLLFEELGLLESGEFASEECRSKGIRLLEYLAWGTAVRAEFALPFQKLLCAQPPGQPLRPVALSSADTEEADSVLDAVIRHWAALKNTGRDGLRNTFLQRNGKLEIDEGQATLTVERQSVDVLLGQLPWSYSVLRLPWMADPLTVNWQ